MLISPYLGLLIDWISMSDCSYGEMPVIEQINIWFPVESLPPILFLSLCFLLSLASEWENGKSAQWISSGWLGLSQWTPVDPGCQMCLSSGVSSRICLLGLWEFVGVDRRCGGGCRAECCPSLGPATHTVFFSIRHCQYTADAGVWWLYLSYGGISHATCYTWTKSSITHAFDWHFQRVVL